MKKRVNFRLSEEQVQDLKEIKAETGIEYVSVVELGIRLAKIALLLRFNKAIRKDLYGVQPPKPVGVQKKVDLNTQVNEKEVVFNE